MSKAAATRHTILQKAFELIYRNGFQTTSIDTIIASTQVTKGAFFYHFKNKDEMGLALINELIKPSMEESFIKPLIHSNRPTDDIYAMMKHLLLTAPFFEIQYGCPAVNLANEIGATNEALYKALYAVMNQCVQAVRHSVKHGQALGQIRQDVDAAEVADFIMVGYSGIRQMGKLFGVTSYQAYLRELKRYLHELA
jgi:TetR/AcrR family transcriptional repressor of nem operon